MRTLKASALLALLALIAAEARGDGLLYELPADGASAQFDVVFTGESNGTTRTGRGTLWMSSVGTEVVDGQKCRWIEFKMQVETDSQQRVIIAKVLIPEKRLKKGETPIAHLVRGWLKMGDRDEQPLNDIESRAAGPLPAFLCGPLKDAKKLPKAIVESGLGKLECEGVSGYTDFKQGGDDIRISFETRLHEKAPFGVVTTRMELKRDRDRNGQQQETAALTLKLVEVGKSASTELPNSR